MGWRIPTPTDPARQLLGLFGRGLALRIRALLLAAGALLALLFAAARLGIMARVRRLLRAALIRIHMFLRIRHCMSSIMNVAAVEPERRAPSTGQEPATHGLRSLRGDNLKLNGQIQPMDAKTCGTLLPMVDKRVLLTIILLAVAQNFTVESKG